MWKWFGLFVKLSRLNYLCNYHEILNERCQGYRREHGIPLSLKKTVCKNLLNIKYIRQMRIGKSGTEGHSSTYIEW